MKVLMIGPGEPTSQNSGLGIAAAELTNELQKILKITVIEPVANLPEDQKSNIVISHNSNVMVTKELSRVKISTTLNPYFYPTDNTILVKEEESKVKTMLTSYTKDVVNNGKKMNADLIYAHDWMSIDAGLELKNELKLPLVLHIHSLDYDRSTKVTDSWLFKLEQKGMETADAIIAVSNYHKNIMIDEYGITASKIHVIHWATHLPNVIKKKKKFNEKLIVFAGRLTEQKGPDKFIEIAKLVQEKDDNTRFVIAGTGDLLEHLVDSVIYQGLKGKLHFTGQISRLEMTELFGMADVFCMPSVSEPFGLIAIEAAAHEVPVVLSKQSGAAEVLPTAFTANFWDTKAFASQIHELIHDEALGIKSAKENKQKLKAHNWKTVANRIHIIFDKIAV